MSDQQPDQGAPPHDSQLYPQLGGELPYDPYDPNIPWQPLGPEFVPSPIQTEAVQTAQPQLTFPPPSFVSAGPTFYQSAQWGEQVNDSAGFVGTAYDTTNFGTGQGSIQSQASVTGTNIGPDHEMPDPNYGEQYRADTADPMAVDNPQVMRDHPPTQAMADTHVPAPKRKSRSRNISQNPDAPKCDYPGPCAKKENQEAFSRMYTYHRHMRDLHSVTMKPGTTSYKQHVASTASQTATPSDPLEAYLKNRNVKQDVTATQRKELEKRLHEVPADPKEKDAEIVRQRETVLKLVDELRLQKESSEALLQEERKKAVDEREQLVKDYEAKLKAARSSDAEFVQSRNEIGKIRESLLATHLDELLRESKRHKLDERRIFDMLKEYKKGENGEA